MRTEFHIALRYLFAKKRHNVINILIAVALCIELGLSASQIKKGISKLKPVESRMEPLILDNGAIVINNGYNSNPNSAECSLDILKMFKDKNRVVITPGFVEMGDEQYWLNFEWGNKISQVANKCIVVKKINRDAIVNGLKKNNFKNIELVDNFKNIDFKIFNKNDVILIENDLPDNYI